MITIILLPIVCALIVNKVTSSKEPINKPYCPPHNWSRDILAEQTCMCLSCGKTIC
jgi:hypothetical protein